MNRIMRELLNTAIYLLCVLGAVWLVITFVGQRTEVEGASMENTCLLYTSPSPRDS